MNFRKQILAIAFLIGLFSPIQKSGAVEKGLAGHQVVRLQAFPEKIQLNSPFAYRQLVLSAHLENGKIDLHSQTIFAKKLRIYKVTIVLKY